MVKIPDKSLLPGTGPDGNGISPKIKTQQDWIDTIKNSCQSCHALGSQGVRRIPKAWGHFDNSVQAWTQRLQAGQTQANKFYTLNPLPQQKNLACFSYWTAPHTPSPVPPRQAPPPPQSVQSGVIHKI